ncbi:hypothetical protein L9F63_002407 [Diploptera punctata]|uniref:Uncharacterized protein n=1 Tax=Diploptera punctata TaxID=6984 RepID=A0AAD7ZRX3_DIPPU|nr:hypothetical protein L9F63_002407 [Diploptera punctata]
MIEPVVLVHGGAGDIPDSRVEPKLLGVRKSAKKGYLVLKNGGTVIDAVQAAVQVMEDDEAFNAGYGSVLNEDGEVEMDAIIMEGTEMKAGAVGALKNVANPIDVARLVMEKTPHVLLVGEGAKQFANKQGVPDVPTEQLISEFAKLSLKDIKCGGSATTELGKDGGVGCNIHLGNIIGKMVWDVPFICCGGFADDNVGAVSTTGHGESIMRFCLAHAILTHMKQGKTAEEATKEGCLTMTQRVGDTAGAITISCRGDIGISFTSKRMAWAYQCGNRLCSGIEKDQNICEDLP